MIKINENYLKLQASYLFSDIARKVAAFQEANPDRDVIKLGGAVIRNACRVNDDTNAFGPFQ